MDIANNSVKLFTTMNKESLASLDDRRLLDWHRKCHMLYGANIKKQPVNKKFINDIVTLHNHIVKEILKRGFQHNTPLERV